MTPEPESTPKHTLDLQVIATATAEVIPGPDPDEDTP